MITLRDIIYIFFYILFKRKWTLVFTAFIVALLVVFYTFLSTPLYLINSLIMVHQNPKQQLILFRDINTPAQASERIHPAFNLKEIVTSRELSEAIVKEYGLGERLKKKRFEPEEARDIIKAFLADVLDLPFHLLDYLGILEPGAKDFMNDAVEDLMYNLIEVSVLSETEILNINVYYEDPELALAISKSVVKELAAKTVEFETQKSAGAYLFAQGQVENEAMRLKDVEDRYLRFQKERHVVGLERERQLLIDRLDDLEAETMKLNRNIALNTASLAEVQTLIKNGEPMMGKGRPREDVIPEGYKLSPSWSHHYVELNTKAADYMISIEGQKEQLSVLNEQLREIQAKVSAIPLKEIQLHRLQRERDNQESLYQGILDKKNEFQIQKLSERTEFDIKIINAPSLPEYPDPAWPEWDLMVAIAVGCGMFIGVLTVFVLEQFSETISEEFQLQRVTQVRFLGCIPDLSRFTRSKGKADSKRECS
jgi:uncharacterized protein involved in exopolysaccharide biosynthesis